MCSFELSLSFFKDGSVKWEIKGCLRFVLAMTDLEKKLEQIIQSRAERGLLRKLSLENNLCDFSSNDYLGLARNSEVRNLFISSLSTLKNSSESVSGSGGLALLGSTGSRLLNGNSRAALALEDFLASYHRAPSALLVNSGYDGNLSFFGYVPQHKDAILYDELIHASVHDGVKISRAQFIHQFKHNNVEDLKRLCKQFNDQIKNREDQGNIFVAVETVYSMDGDLAPLKDLVDCAKEFSNVYIIVDEAHATGTFGEQGRGLVCDLGLEKYIFARLHTFGKAMGNHGAVILGSTILRDYLINYARPIIYSTFLSHHSLIGIRCAYEILSQNYVQVCGYRVIESTQI
ncbi:hypothetical protein HK096_007598 [Nowakowskiella sp. JEL0078]|nr:hypothetical protein HK096_007598 [Nowakowskiella sp. JEL0078]